MAKKDEELVVVEDEEGTAEGERVVVDEEAHAQAEGQDRKEDERLAQDDEEEQESADDTAATEELRAQRRAERRAKKDRAQLARERNRRELEFLRRRNEDLERRFSAVEQRTVNTESATIDDRISQVDQQIRVAQEVMATAVDKNEGKNLVEAQDIYQSLLRNREQLQGRKTQLARERDTRTSGAQEQRQQAPDPEMLRHAGEWTRANPWFSLNGTDDDSAIVTTIDNKLVAEGFNPSSPEYWEELTDRAKRYLPHRFQKGNDDGDEEKDTKGRANGNGQRQASRGPVMANGMRERALRPGEVYVSPDRRRAMEEAGVWEDPKLRQRYLKAYAEYDKQAQA